MTDKPQRAPAEPAEPSRPAPDEGERTSDDPGESQTTSPFEEPIMREFLGSDDYGDGQRV